MGKVGKFITVEGGEGAGKSLAIQSVKKHLEGMGYEVVLTREPGGVPLAERIRELTLDKDITEMDIVTEMFLFAASRREHLVKKVLPALEDGKVVLCDRFVDSSFVYQGIVGGLGVDFVWDVNKAAIGELMPDFTLYMDLDPEIGLARIEKNADREVNRMDLKPIEYHQAVRKGYLDIAERFTDRIEVVDASGTVDEVVGLLLGVVDARLAT